MRLAALILAPVLLIVQAVPAQPAGDLAAATAQIHRSRCGEGVETLTALASGGDLEAQRAAYLMGWCLTKLDRHREAAEAYQRSVGHPTLGALARIEAGLAHVRAGSAASAPPMLREAAAGASGKLRGRALAALGQAELQRRNPSAAADVLADAVRMRPSDPNAWLLLAEAAASAGRPGVAARARTLAAWAFPGNAVEAQARVAAARVDAAGPGLGGAPAERRMRQGRRFASRGTTKPAVAEFTRVIAIRGTGRLAAEAWYRLAEIWMPEDPAASLVALQRATALGWNSVTAYQRIAAIARRLELQAEERDANEALARTGPRVWAAGSWLASGRRAEKAGRVADAADRYRRAIAANPPSHSAAEARWRLGWLALRAGRFSEAEERYREAAQAAPSRGEAARAWYWVAKTMEAHGSAGADEVLQLVAKDYPLAFYGQRARMRLKAGAPSLAPSPPRVLPREAAGLAHEELAGLGLDVEAVAAANDALAAATDLELIRFLAEAYGRLGAYRRSVALAEQALTRGMRDEAMWRLAYPKAYWSLVAAAAEGANIDPLLLLALIREESRFDTDAVSPAHAVGLAQLLPSTAREMAGDRSLGAAGLTEPATNLRLGAQYLRVQLNRFGGDVRLALAAYNAGPGSARGWARLDQDPDYLVEKISIAETRAYVRNVVASYGVYRVLWCGCN